MRMLLALFSALLIYSSMPYNPIPEKEPEPSSEDPLPIFSFGIIADVQYCDCEPAGTRFYRSSLLKLKEAVNTFRSDSQMFVINMGDLIEKGFESYKPVMNILDSSGLKVYHLTGNHDYSVDPRMKQRIPPLLSTKKGYYSFNAGRYRFIALNGNEISTYATEKKKVINDANILIDKLKAEGEPNGLGWNGGIGPVQIQWLKAQLDESVSKNEYVFLLCHFPVFPQNMHNLLNYREVLSMLGNYSNIIAWFNGHNHAGNYGNFNMIHFVTLRGMVETETTGSFSTVEVYRNKIWIKGEGREKSQILAY